MSLRRHLAYKSQGNAAHLDDDEESPAASPSRSRMNGPPVTPARNARPSIGLYRSPASTPSIASSIPFDWDAARSHKPAPYGTPLRKKTSGVGGGAPRKAIVRKKSLYTR